MTGSLYELVDGAPAMRLALVDGATGGPVVSGSEYEIVGGALALRAKVVGGSAGGGSGITQAQLDAAIAPLATTTALNQAIAAEAQARQEAIAASDNYFVDLRGSTLSTATGSWSSPVYNMCFPLPGFGVRIKNFYLLYGAFFQDIPVAEFSAQLVGVANGSYVQPSGLAPAFSVSKPFPQSLQVASAWASILRIDLIDSPLSILAGGQNRPSYLTIATKRDGQSSASIRLVGIEVVWNSLTL